MKPAQRSWSRLGYPVIAQVADSEPAMLTRVVQLLEDSGSVAGLELFLHPEADPFQARLLIEAVGKTVELPLWVKLPFDSAQRLAAVAIEAGAAALVISQSPLGAAYRSGGVHAETLMMVSGSFCGTASYPMVLHKVMQIIALDLGAPVIACGGIHSWYDARTFLDAGAAAVQLDSVLWVEPGIASDIVAAWTAENASAIGH